MTFMDKFWKKYKELDHSASDYASKSFKKIPYLDRWSTNAKIILLVMATVPPFLLTFFWITNFMRVRHHNSQVDEKYRQLNENAMGTKKN